MNFSIRRIFVNNTECFTQSNHQKLLKMKKNSVCIDVGGKQRLFLPSHISTIDTDFAVVPAVIFVNLTNQGVTRAKKLGLDMEDNKKIIFIISDTPDQQKMVDFSAASTSIIFKLTTPFDHTCKVLGMCGVNIYAAQAMLKTQFISSCQNEDMKRVLQKSHNLTKFVGYSLSMKNNLFPTQECFKESVLRIKSSDQMGRFLSFIYWTPTAIKDSTASYVKALTCSICSTPTHLKCAGCRVTRLCSVACQEIGNKAHEGICTKLAVRRKEIRNIENPARFISSSYHTSYRKFDSIISTKLRMVIRSHLRKKDILKSK